ncbi:MAG: orotate phosphoribosyltransferase [Gemmatimonadaceae bacterium]
MTDYQSLVQLLAQKSLKRGQFTLASGKISDIYIDVRMTSMSPEGLSQIGPLALQAIRATGWSVDSIGGMTLGADPITYAISYASSLNGPSLRAFTVRKDAKLHGTGKMIEGPFTQGDRVVIVEDVITTGNSALQAINTVRKAGGQIKGVLALVDRKEGGLEAIEREGYSVISLTTIDELISALTDVTATRVSAAE